MDKFWNDIIYTVCEGDAASMAGLKKFEICDFFDYIENKKKKNARS